MGLPKRKQTSRRGFLKVVGLGAAGAIGGKAALEVARTTAAYRQKRASALAVRATHIRAAKIPNHTKWARLTEIYKLDPVKNSKDRAFVDVINKVSKEVSLTPERILITIELNEISDSQIQSIRASMKRNSAETIARKERIIQVIKELQKIKTHQEIKSRIKGSKGSLDKVIAFEKTQK